MSNMHISLTSLSLSRTTGLPDHAALATEASLTVEGADSNFADALCGARTQLHALVPQVKRTLIHPDTHTHVHARMGCIFLHAQAQLVKAGPAQHVTCFNYTVKLIFMAFQSSLPGLFCDTP